jgi:hypothetical protein
VGVGVEEFWALTPAETFAVLEAGIWRMEQEQRGRAWLAWHVAALGRAKKLPSLKRLMGGGKTRVLSGEELEKRKAEHEAMAAQLKAQSPKFKAQEEKA